MIANITPTARSRSLYGALEYNKLKLDNGEAKAIFANNIIVPRNELDRLKLPYLQRCFQPYLDQNRRTKATVFHCSLNPHPNDRLDEQQLRIMAQEYMEQLGYGEQPYVVYLHKDIDREHLHIVSLRVKLDGTAISSSNERRRSKAITEELERKYGLHPAEESLRKNDIDNLKVIDYKRGDLKQQTASIVRTILEKYQFASVILFMFKLINGGIMYNLLANSESMNAVEEFTSTVPIVQKGTNHAENPLETNMTLQYGILIGVLVVLVSILVYRKVKNKKKK